MTSRVSPRQLLSPPPTPSSGRYLVSSRRRNPQLHLCARIKFTPDRQLASHQLGAFAHAPQTVVSGASLLIKMPRLNALPIISDPQPKLTLVISDFHLDSPRLCVLEGIAQRLACNRVRFAGREFSSQSAYRQRNIVGHCRRGAQPLDGIPAFGDRFRGLIDRAVEASFGFLRMLGQQIRRRLKSQQKSLKALKQSVVQFPRDTGALTDALF